MKKLQCAGSEQHGGEYQDGQYQYNRKDFRSVRLNFILQYIGFMPNALEQILIQGLIYHAGGIFVLS